MITNYRFFIFMLLGVISINCNSQRKYIFTHEILKEFEGTYEYVNDTKLEIAASPRDTLLYAIINESKYALTPFKKDVFLNSLKQEVTFIRNKSKDIIGYTVNDKNPYLIFKLITKDVTFSDKMWHPRLSTEGRNFLYQYVLPQNLHDGLNVDSLKNSG